MYVSYFFAAFCDYWRFGTGGHQENVNAVCILALNIINDKVDLCRIFHDHWIVVQSKINFQLINAFSHHSLDTFLFSMLKTYFVYYLVLLLWSFLLFLGISNYVVVDGHVGSACISQAALQSNTDQVIMD